MDKEKLCKLMLETRIFSHGKVDAKFIIAKFETIKITEKEIHLLGYEGRKRKIKKDDIYKNFYCNNVNSKSVFTWVWEGDIEIKKDELNSYLQHKIHELIENNKKLLSSLWNDIEEKTFTDLS